MMNNHISTHVYQWRISFTTVGDKAWMCIDIPSKAIDIISFYSFNVVVHV